MSERRTLLERAHGFAAELESNRGGAITVYGGDAPVVRELITRIHRLEIAARRIVGAWDALDAEPSEENGGRPRQECKDLFDIEIDQMRELLESDDKS